MVLFVDLGSHAGHIVQQRLTIFVVDLAVAVEVAMLQTGGILGFDGLTIDAPSDIRRDQRCPRIFKVDDGVVREAVTENILREEIRIKGERCIGVLHIINGKAKGIQAVAVGIVAKLRLDLAVLVGIGRVGIHQQIAAAGNRSANVGKSGALTKHGIVTDAVFAIILDHRLSGGHEQALCQRTHRQAGLFRQTVFLDVLRDDCRHARDLRRSHGGTGHILVRAAVLQGVDVAAGGGNFRLQLQRTGNAPGGEVAHGIVVIRCDGGCNTFSDIELAGVVQDLSAPVPDCGRLFLDHERVGQRDADSRLRLGVVGEVHVDAASLVVRNDGRDCAVTDSVLRLYIEGDLTAVADGDLTVQNVLDGLEFFGSAERIDVDELVLTSEGEDADVRILVAIAVLEGLVVEDLRAVHLNVVAGLADIIDRGNGKGVRERAGLTVGLPAHGLGVRIAKLRILKPVAGVTRGHRNDHAAVGDPLENGFISSVGIVRVAGVSAAEGQVCRIRAEHHGVLNSRHIVGVVSAAALAEHLHDQKLRIRRNTLCQDAIQSIGIGSVAVGRVAVSRRDTGDMGTVIALGVIVVRNIQIFINIVEAVRNLGIDIKLLGSRALAALDRVELPENLGRIGSSHRNSIGALYRIAVCKRIEGRMIGVRAGVNDGNLAACAGVAGSPCSDGADHFIGGRHVRVGRLVVFDDARLIARLNKNLLNAGNLLDRFDLTILHVCGNDIRSESQIPHDVEFFAVQSFLGDGLFHLLLLAFQPHAVLHGAGIRISDLLGGKALFQGGITGQHDGNTDDVRIRVLRFFLIGCDMILHRKVNVHRIVVDLLERNLVLCRCVRIHRDGRCDEAHRQNEHKQHGNDLFPEVRVFHMHSLTFPGNAGIVAADDLKSSTYNGIYYTVLFTKIQ